MELATGGDLLTYLSERTCLDEAEAMRYFRDLAAAVDFLHSQNIAHRDLKLENVVLTASGACKLCDFGLAYEYSGHDVRAPLYDVCGSKSYVAPEVLVEMGYDGCLADIWSLGICLFAMTTGFFPFVEASAHNSYFAETQKLVGTCGSFTLCVFGLYRTPCTLSASTVSLIDSLLKIAPAQRCSARTALACEWEASATTHDEQLQRATRRGCPIELPSFDSPMESPTPTFDTTSWFAPTVSDSSCPSYWLGLAVVGVGQSVACC
jgi:serine/threonine protein kinase